MVAEQADVELRLEVGDRPLNLRRTIESVPHGPRDPTSRRDGPRNWRTERNAEGPSLWSAELVDKGARVLFRAWGPGAEDTGRRAAGLVGLEDPGTGDWVPEHPLLRDLSKQFAGIRLPKGTPMMEVLLMTILGQRVHGREAVRNWRMLSYKFGGRPPGPEHYAAPLAVPPDPRKLGALDVWELHRFGVERSRARTMMSACRVAKRIDEAAEMGPEEACKRLAAVPGIGIWTAMNVVARTHGYADAVPVGDYHLPNTVAYGLAGEERADDDRMLELLEPYKPHRYRVLKWLGAGGVSAPKRGHRRGTFYEELKRD